MARAPSGRAVISTGAEMNVTMLTDRLRLRGLWLFALLITATLVLSACDLVGDDDDQDEQQEQQAQQEMQEEEPAAAPAARPAAREPAAEPTREPPPQAQGGGEGARAYSIVFPSLALVMTEQAVATGLVISDGYVVVDERSLRGAGAANVLLSNGETLEGVAIAGRDLHTGLAYLGPLDNNLVRRLPGARLGDGEGIRPGSSVFTIGYSTDDQAGSLPSIYSGVLSGVDEWEPGQRTFLRTDARPDSPFSTVGMILVDGAGTVIGIAPAGMVGLGWYVSTGDLARSLSADQMAESIPAPAVVTATEHTLTLSPGQRSASLLLSDEATGQSALITVRTETASVLQMFDVAGELLQEATLVIGSTIVALAPETAGPYEIVISPEPVSAMEGDEEDEASGAMSEPPTYQVSASVPLMVVVEAEDMAVLSVNEPFVGNIDIPGDADSFNVAIRAGAVYEVLAQSLLIDTVLLVQGGGLDAVDDDTGGGPFGRDSALTLAPAEDGIISVTVKDYADEGTGAYMLTITQISGEMPDEETAMEEQMASSEARLPTPRGDVSVRGEITEDGLRPTLLGIGSELSEDGSLIVRDGDGIFEIVASIVGPDQSTARIFVFTADDQTVVSGRVVANCETADPCLASAVFITPEDSPGPAGEWRVLLQPEGAGSGITEWQIEVHLYDQSAE